MTIDVAAFQSDSPYATQALATPANNGLAVSGMEKLVQRFVLELMTVKNEVPQSAQGCDFVNRLIAGVASETDVFLAFNASLNDVVNRLRAVERAADESVEKLASVAILNLTLANGSLSLNLRLRNQTGETQNVSLPLHFLVN